MGADAAAAGIARTCGVGSETDAAAAGIARTFEVGFATEAAAAGIARTCGVGFDRALAGVARGLRAVRKEHPHCLQGRWCPSRGTSTLIEAVCRPRAFAADPTHLVVHEAL